MMSFDELVQARRTGVVRGFARGWPALASWSFEGLAEAHGSLRAPIMRTSGGVIRTGARGVDDDIGTLGDFVARVAAGEVDPGYLNAGLDQLPSELRDAIIAPPIWRRAAVRRGKLWMSPRGVVSPLHFDASDNLHVQLRGRKIFRTYAPAERRNLYPCSLFSNTPNFNRVDPEAPDLRRFPDFARAKAVVYELEPGDAIFLPVGHWHHVRSAEQSVSVNFWWANGPRALVSMAGDAWKRVRRLGR